MTRKVKVGIVEDPVGIKDQILKTAKCKGLKLVEEEDSQIEIDLSQLVLKRVPRGNLSGVSVFEKLENKKVAGFSVAVDLLENPSAYQIEWIGQYQLVFKVVFKNRLKMDYLLILIPIGVKFDFFFIPVESIYKYFNKSTRFVCFK